MIHFQQNTAAVLGPGSTFKVRAPLRPDTEWRRALAGPVLVTAAQQELAGANTHRYRTVRVLTSVADTVGNTVTLQVSCRVLGPHRRGHRVTACFTVPADALMNQ